MKRKKWLIAALCLCIISTLMITSAAVVKYKFTSSSGNTVLKTVNRVDIEVSDTAFTFNKADKDGLLVCTTTVSIKKTEPDFYGALNSITLEGQNFQYTLFTAAKDNPTADLPENLILPVNDNEPSPLEWEITFAFPYEEGKKNYDISLNIDYTTGIKTNVTQRYQTTIPITVTVE